MASKPILKPSSEKLPPSDPREAVFTELDKMCRELVETVHLIHQERNERMIGRLEERIYTMVDNIHRRQREAYLNDGIFVAVTHTEDGLPIRATKTRKVQLWGL